LLSLKFTEPALESRFIYVEAFAHFNLTAALSRLLKASVMLPTWEPISNKVARTIKSIAMRLDSIS
jgi:hypothetical protein